MTGAEIRTPPYFAVFRGREEIARCLTATEVHNKAMRAAEEAPGVRIVTKRVTKSGRRYWGSTTIFEPTGMTESWTPGPWRTGGIFATRVLSDHIEGGEICYCIPTIPIKEGGESAANARLIAAAPELYMALSAMAAAEISDPRPPTDAMPAAYAMARSALAKALGEPR